MIFNLILHNKPTTSVKLPIRFGKNLKILVQNLVQNFISENRFDILLVRINAATNKTAPANTNATNDAYLRRAGKRRTRTPRDRCEAAAERKDLFNRFFKF